jgi:integrase
MASSRVALPVTEWPAADRAAWEALFREGDLLDGRGEAAHWAPATRKTNQSHYARWLGWLAASDLLDADATPAERATPALVTDYARSLLDRVAPRTAASALIGLKCVLQRMSPDAEWGWLKDMSNRLDSWAVPSRARRTGDLDAGGMFARVLAELDACAAGPLAMRRDQIRFRDTLILSLLIACPVRLRNLAMMEIGHHLLEVGDQWRLRFDASETKTRQPIDLVVPDALAPWVCVYLDRVRTAFPGAAAHPRVWIACKKYPMAEETIYMRVRMRSLELFGVALSPHEFRTIAATALAESSPEDALYARPLLGHRQPETTAKHYIHASQLKASRQVADALVRIRDF